MYFYYKRATVVHVRAAPLVVREKTIGTEQGRTRVDGSGSIRDKSANDKRANTWGRHRAVRLLHKSVLLSAETNPCQLRSLPSFSSRDRPFTAGERGHEEGERKYHNNNNNNNNNNSVTSTYI